jgi:hypothetical protein
VTKGTSNASRPASFASISSLSVHADEGNMAIVVGFWSPSGSRAFAGSHTTALGLSPGRNGQWFRDARDLRPALHARGQLWAGQSGLATWDRERQDLWPTEGLHG